MTDKTCREKLLESLYKQRLIEEERIAHAKSMIKNYLDMQERSEKMITEIDESVKHLQGQEKTPSI